MTKDFATRHLLNNHRNPHHDESWPRGTPRNFPGCQLPDDHYFVSPEDFRWHLSTHHLLDNAQAREYIGKTVNIAYTAPRGTSRSHMITMCLFPRGETTAEFGNYSGYTGHLKGTHKQSPEDYLKFMPTAHSVRLHPRPSIAEIDVSSPMARGFEPGPCNHPLRSDFDTRYDREAPFVRHLNVSHGVAKEDALIISLVRRRCPFFGTACLHPDCELKIKFFFEAKSYPQPLKEVHGLSTVVELNASKCGTN